MEAIREYLNNLFMNLPETPEVLRAKAELMEMMEDKYDELIKEGKSEAEAIGIVISEFGNLEELSDELGIGDYIKKEKEDDGEKPGQGKKTGTGAEKMRTVYCWGFDEARDYISYAWKHAMYIAVGVFLCICSPFADSVLDGCAEAGYLPAFIADAIGTGVLFLFVAAAVGLFCAASAMRKGYGKLSRFCVLLDEKAGHYVEQKSQYDAQKRLTMRIAGVSCCILSVVPSSINHFANPLISEIFDSSLLFIVGIGVLLLVLSASVGNRYDELKKAVKNAGNKEGTTFQGEIWKPVSPKKMPKTAVIVLILVGTLVVGGNMTAGILFMRTDDYSQENDVQEYAFDSIRELVLDVDCADLKVETAGEQDDNGLVRVEHRGSGRNRPQVDVSGDRIQIRVRQKSWWHWLSFGSSRKQEAVTVYVPRVSEEREYDMKIDTDAGNITCTGISPKNLNVDLDAGNIFLKHCRGVKAAIEVDAGNMEAQDCDFNILKGDVDAGSFKCRLQGPIEKYNMELDVDLGKIVVNDEKKGTSYSQPSSAGEWRQIEAEVDAGNIEIETVNE